MRRTPIRSSIRPKISTMPRQPSEAASFLDVYKLVVEKKRLQQELGSIDIRRDQIQSRLGVLEQQIQTAENRAHALREADKLPESEARAIEKTLRSAYTEQAQTGQFKTITLDY
ncbi:MAG: hypothetical protein WBA57_10130 [Elainellaceae cyanobacterium]